MNNRFLLIIISLGLHGTINPSSVKERKKAIEEKMRREQEEKAWQVEQRKPATTEAKRRAAEQKAQEEAEKRRKEQEAKELEARRQQAAKEKAKRKEVAIPMIKKKMSEEDATKLLIDGVVRGNLEAVREALDQGADKETNIQRETPLVIAVLFGYEDIARLLAIKGAKIGDALKEAAKIGNERMVTLLLATGPAPEIMQQALDKALEYGRANIVQLFIERMHISRLNVQDANGLTLLMRAVEYGQKNIVELLLSYGVDTQLKDKAGLTALDYALMKNREDIVTLLTAGFPNAKEEIENAWLRIKAYKKKQKAQSPTR